MRARTAISLILVAGVLFVALMPRVEAALIRDAPGCPHSGDVPKREKIGATRGQIVCLLNQERARHGLQVLRYNPLLELASQRHSEDMAARNFFAHNTPDGVDPQARMAAAGYSLVGRHTGENLYWGEEMHAPPVSAMRSWMNSPGHRANILNASFREIGIGVAYDAPVPHGGKPVGTYATDFGARS
jgi:uncharacterized protein YkwD